MPDNLEITRDSLNDFKKIQRYMFLARDEHAKTIYRAQGRVPFSESSVKFGRG